MDRVKLKQQVSSQITELLAARDKAAGAAARDAIIAEIDRVRGIEDIILVGDAGIIATSIEEAVDALEDVRTKHALDIISNLTRAIDGLSAAEVALKQEAPSLAKPTPGAGMTGPALAAVAGAAVVALAAAKIVKTQSATKFDSLRDEYASLFEQCRTRPDRQKEVNRLAGRIKANQARYEAVGGPLGIPWQFIGVVHAMEANLDFSTHLHNGDPLTARTKQVPVGRPVAGAPPFTWEESAIDALKVDRLDQNTDWSVPRMLFLLERFNGFGYRLRSVPTPYLWSFSNLYEKGKFSRDGKFDASAISKQCGAALLLKGLN